MKTGPIGIGECRFDTPTGRQAELREMVAENIYQSGFDAIRAHMRLEDA